MTLMAGEVVRHAHFIGGRLACSAIGIPERAVERGQRHGVDEYIVLVDGVVAKEVGAQAEVERTIEI
ncbi:hypothetical protein D3C83_41420 [compost metagenome]